MVKFLRKINNYIYEYDLKCLTMFFGIFTTFCMFLSLINSFNTFLNYNNESSVKSNLETSGVISMIKKQPVSDLELAKIS